MRILTKRGLLAASLALSAASMMTAVVESAPSAAAVAAATSAPPATSVPAAASAPATPGAGAYKAIIPVRILATHSGLGVAKGAVPAGRAITVRVAGRGGLPTTGMSAVVLSVTALAPSGHGAVLVYPAGATRPKTTNLEFSHGRAASDLVLVRPGHGGKVILRVDGSGHVQLAVDVEGYVLDGGSTVGSGGIRAVPAKRVVDTQIGRGVAKGAVSAGHAITVRVAGRGGLPTSGLSAVLVTVTALAPTGHGGVVVYPAGGALPKTADLQFAHRRPVSELVLVPLGGGGRLALRVDGSGHTQLAVDVNGYVRGSGATQPGGVIPTAPTALFNTKTGRGTTKGAVGAGHAITVQVTGRAGVPSEAVAAVALAVTVARPSGSGELRAFPAGLSSPGTTNLEFTRGHAASGLVLVHVGKSGKATFRVDGSGREQLAAAVVGYVSTTSTLSWGAPHEFDAEHDGVPDAISCTSATACMAVDNDSAIQLTNSGWAAPTEIAPGPNANGLQSVSCVGADFCAAIGYNAQVEPDATYVAVLKAGTWTSTDVSSFAAGGGSISCASATSCWGIDYDANLYQYDGSSWTESTTLSNADEGMLGISCPTLSFCMAVGATGQFTTYNGATWTALTSVTSHPVFLSVSCTSSTFCIALDASGNAYEYTGSGWGSATAVTTNQLNGVTCSTTTSCLAVDNVGDGFWFNGVSWSPTTIASGADLLAVSCSSPIACQAVDIANHAYGWNGISWTDPTTIDASHAHPDGVSCWSAKRCRGTDEFGSEWSFDGGVWSRRTLDGVNDQPHLPSCPSASFCMAIDSSERAVRFSRTKTGTPVVPLSDPANIEAMTCSSSTFCMVLNDDNYYSTYNGTSWSPQQHIEGNTNRFYSVSCTSKPYCVAVSLSGQAFTFNGKKWSAPVVASSDELLAVSCAAPGWCVALTAHQDVVVLDNSTWRSMTMVSPSRSMDTVSCPEVNDCVATDSSGGSYQYDGVVWTRATIEGGSELTGLSCPSISFCLAVSYTGEAIVGR